MKLREFTRRVRLPCPAAKAYAWHLRPGAFERLTPPWIPVERVSRPEPLQPGMTVTLRQRFGPFTLTWVVEHGDFVDGVQFRDVQKSGPFARWEHLHRVEPDGPNACVLTDEIRYALPLGLPGAVGARKVERDLDRLFRYRHATIRDDLTDDIGIGRPLRIAMAGGSGLVGRALAPYLTTQGHTVVRLVRREAASPSEITWDPRRGSLDLDRAGPLDAVVNLAGAGIADGRWSRERRELILNSRIDATRTLARAIAAAKTPPAVLVNFSAVGFYGDGGESEFDESSSAGDGFLASVCRQWEHEAGRAAEAGVRPVFVRTGMVLTAAGGALARMLPLFRLGLGGRMGSGRQWTSWISIDDLSRLVHRALLDRTWRGPVNGVAPNPVRQQDFASILGRVLRRPAILPSPGWAMRAGLGDMADELLLAGARVVPGVALSGGFSFRHESLEMAFRHTLGR